MAAGLGQCWEQEVWVLRAAPRPRGDPRPGRGSGPWGCLTRTAKGHPLAQAGSHADMGRGRDWAVFPVDQTWDVGPRDQSP